ncbi:hypothetical protein BOO69_08350 [Sulfitobacter alexandrii]|uniref:Peptidase S74 domain-containing protein n=1 Tax=Sulfitobacter alexandrii TaxID=1917485 RepID=A0A1J0WGJ5_9RHOB|nr:hypothetical protein [Sulfitobacter alexandrii]APE43427.1 hypothetical protein BOO69_08350 [Sulfitobacter alexandrii]
MRAISHVSCAGLIASTTLLSGQVQAQNLLATTDATIRHQLCVGSACPDSPFGTFPDSGASSVKMSGVRTRLDFVDSSGLDFPDNDWALVVNDSNAGGAEYFSIQDTSSGTVPFSIAAGASSNAMYIASNNRVGLGTSLPSASIDIVQASPGIRFKPLFNTTEWNVLGANRFTISNDDTLDWIFSIDYGAPESSLAIVENGNIGIGTQFPQEALTVYTGADGANAFALFTAEGPNSDSGFLIRQLGDIPTTWEFRNQQSSGRLNVGIAGGNTPFKIDNTAANNLLKLGRNGRPDEVVVTGKLVVNNTELNVPDYVFAADYPLRPLAEVREFIDTNSHLPDVPSEAEIKANGVDMTAMQMTLLKKVEELTLYTLAQEDIIAKQQVELRELDQLKAQMARIEALLSKRAE